MRGRSALTAGLCLAGTAFGKFGSRGLRLLAGSKGTAFGPSRRSHPVPPSPPRVEAKGRATIAKGAPPHRYRPAVCREDWAAAERQGLLDRVYQGSAGKLVAAFVRDGALTAQEREELRRLLDDMEV